jgi:hypothetical protein
VEILILSLPILGGLVFLGFSWLLTRRGSNWTTGAWSGLMGAVLGLYVAMFFPPGLRWLVGVILGPFLAILFARVLLRVERGQKETAHVLVGIFIGAFLMLPLEFGMEEMGTLLRTTLWMVFFVLGFLVYPLRRTQVGIPYMALLGSWMVYGALWRFHPSLWPLLPLVWVVSSGVQVTVDRRLQRNETGTPG